MEDTARELAVQALKDSLIAISYYANRRPKCTEEFRTNSEHIRSLSQAIVDIHHVALDSPKEVAGFVVDTQSQPDRNVSICELLGINNDNKENE